MKARYAIGSLALIFTTAAAGLVGYNVTQSPSTPTPEDNQFGLAGEVVTAQFGNVRLYQQSTDLHTPVACLVAALKTAEQATDDKDITLFCSAGANVELDKTRTSKTKLYYAAIPASRPDTKCYVISPNGDKANGEYLCAKKTQTFTF